MANKSEDSFGAKLQNAKKILNFLENISNYKAIRPEDDIVPYKKLILECDEANTIVATHVREYSMATDRRAKAFSNKEDTSLRTLLSPINKTIAAQYDKDSKEYQSTVSIISKMRSQKTTKAETTDAEGKKESVSRSELSFGSMLQNFKDLIATLAVFQDYKPFNPAITVESLQERVKELENLNTEVNNKTTPLNLARSNRTTLFEDLAQRTQRIKNAIAAMFGNSSAEYKQIKGLKI